MNYFEFYAGDYQRDTADLSLAEHGAFLMLLATYYSTERAIPAGYPTLYRLVSAMDETEKKAVEAIAERFFPISTVDGLRHNARADREIVKARARIDISRVNGRKGGRPLKETETQRDTQWVSQEKPSGVPAGKAPHAPCSKDQEIHVSVETPALVPKKPRAKSEAMTLSQWLDTLDDDDPAISYDGPAFKYAESIGVPQEFVELAWWNFKASRIDSPKKQASWPAVFNRAIRENWEKIWWFSPDEGCKLTTVGQQAKRAAG